MSSRYTTDIVIPNLDAMTPAELIAYAKQVAALAADESPQSPRHDWLTLAGRYARYKLKAMQLRGAGNIALAERNERECANIYDQLPKRMRW